MNNRIFTVMLICLVFGLAGSSIAETIEFELYTKDEEPYLINKGTHDFARMVADFGAAFNNNPFRFADAEAYWIYKFDFDKVVMATAIMDLGAEYKVSIAVSDLGNDEDYKVAMEEKNHVHDVANKKIYTVNYSDYFKAPSRKIWIKFQDSIPADGWGPYLDSFKLDYTLGQSVDYGNKLTATWGMI
jgi:hypothetical protein